MFLITNIQTISYFKDTTCVSTKYETKTSNKNSRHEFECLKCYVDPRGMYKIYDMMSSWLTTTTTKQLRLKPNFCNLLLVSCGRGYRSSSSWFRPRLFCTSRQSPLFPQCERRPNPSTLPWCSACQRSSPADGRMCQTCQICSSRYIRKTEHKCLNLLSCAYLFNLNSPTSGWNTFMLVIPKILRCLTILKRDYLDTPDDVMCYQPNFHYLANSKL